MGGNSTSGNNPTRPTESLRRTLQEKNAPKGYGPPKNDDGGKTGSKGGGSNNPNIIRGPSGGYRRYYESQSAAGLGTSSSASSTAQGSPDWIQIAVRPHVQVGVGMNLVRRAAARCPGAVQFHYQPDRRGHRERWPADRDGCRQRRQRGWQLVG